MAIRAGPTERAAGLAFLAFTIMQVGSAGQWQRRRGPRGFAASWRAPMCSHRRLAPQHRSHRFNQQHPMLHAAQVPYFAMRNTAVSNWPATVPLSPLQVRLRHAALQSKQPADVTHCRSLHTASTPQMRRRFHGTWLLLLAN